VLCRQKPNKAHTFAYNVTVHETTGYALFQLMLGRLPVDMIFEPVLQDEQVANYDAYVQALRCDLAEAMKIVQTAVGKQQKREAEFYNRKLKGAPVDVGDRVLLANKDERGRRKLADRWEGHLYVVTEKNEGVHTFSQMPQCPQPNSMKYKRLLTVIGRERLWLLAVPSP